MKALVASAPGKLVLAGEYAVLEGATAIVAAVQARAVVSLVDGAEQAPLPPEVVATRALVERAHGAVPGALAIDVASLRAGAHKLGVGSSAAAAVAAAAVLRHAHGLALDAAGRDAIQSFALEGHRAVAPGGSGIDVVASTFGGVLRFRRRDDRVEHAFLEWPPGLETSVVFTGHSARTSDLVARVRALAASEPAAHREALDAIRREAEAFARAFEAGELSGLLEATRRHHRAMAELGRRAGAPIVEATLSRVAELAERHSGSAKPSGAGGGDVAVAFFESASDRVEFEADARAAGFTLVEATLRGDGVRIDDERATGITAR